DAEGGVTVTTGVSGPGADGGLLPGAAHPLSSTRPRSTIRWPATLWLIPPRAALARRRLEVKEGVAPPPVGARAHAPRAAPPAGARPPAPAAELGPGGLLRQVQAIVRRRGRQVGEVSWGHRAAPRSSRSPDAAPPDLS